MFGRLLILFTLVPAVELYLLIRIGGTIGVERTVAVILITGALGAYLARREGFRVWQQVRAKLDKGAMPGDELIEALLILLAGATLLTPGFLTDAIGFALLIPTLRKPVAASLKQRFAQNLSVVSPLDGPGGFPRPPR